MKEVPFSDDPSPETSTFGSQVISTGSLRLDIALGIGGVPRGRITLFEGPEGSGKSTLCQYIVAQAQQAGGNAAYIDSENALDLAYARHCGIDVDRLYVVQPDCAEQAWGIIETLARSKALNVLVVDSISALVPQSELTAPINGATLPDAGQNDHLLSVALRKLAAVIQQSGTALILTNQIQHKHSHVYHGLHANPARLALKLYACLVLELCELQNIRVKSEIAGLRVIVRVVKNKLGTCYHTANLDIMYNEGGKNCGDILDLANELRIIQKQGPHYLYRNLLLGKDRECAIDSLHQNISLQTEIEQAVRQKLLLAPLPVEG